MHWFYKHSLVPCFIAFLCLSPAAYAQSGDDWDVSTDASRDLIVAEAHYSAGQSIRVQCMAGQVSVGLTGVPPAPGPTRMFQRQRPSESVENSLWELGADGTTLIQNSPRVIRSLKTDTILRLRSSVPGQVPVVIALPLPSQSTGIDAVLTACGRSAENDRDHLQYAHDWVKKYPMIPMEPFPRRFTLVTLELSCLIKNSRLADCRPEYEAPDAGIGWRTARRANGTEIELTDPVAAEGKLLEIVVTGNSIYR